MASADTMTDSVNNTNTGGGNAASPSPPTTTTIPTQPLANSSAQLNQPTSTQDRSSTLRNDSDDASSAYEDNHQYAPGELEATFASMQTSQAMLSVADPMERYQNELYLRVRGMRELIRAGVVSASADDDNAVQLGGPPVGQRLIDVVPERLYLPPEMGGVSDEQLAREMLPGGVIPPGLRAMDEFQASRRRGGNASTSGVSTSGGASTSTTTTTPGNPQGQGRANAQGRSHNQRSAKASTNPKSNGNTARRAAPSAPRSTGRHTSTSRDEYIRAFAPLGTIPPEQGGPTDEEIAQALMPIGMIPPEQGGPTDEEIAHALMPIGMIPPEHGGSTDEEIAQALMPLGMIPPERGGPTDEEIAAAMFGLEPPTRSGAAGRGGSSGRGSGGSGVGKQKRARREGGGGGRGGRRGGGPEEACVVM